MPLNDVKASSCKATKLQNTKLYDQKNPYFQGQYPCQLEPKVGIAKLHLHSFKFSLYVCSAFAESDRRSFRATFVSISKYAT